MAVKWTILSQDSWERGNRLEAMRANTIRRNGLWGQSFGLRVRHDLGILGLPRVPRPRPRERVLIPRAQLAVVG